MAASKTFFQSSSTELLLALFIALVNFTTVTHAQTWTTCNPMNVTTCAPNPALGINNATFNFANDTMDTQIWNATQGLTTQQNLGRAFTVAQRKDSPTIQSNFYIFFGQVSVLMRAATGQGIVSSIVLQSDDLDEVDWEWIGGNTTHVQTNYFGKGNTTSYDRAFWHPVSNPQAEYHNYTTKWTPEKLEWYIDGNLIRTLNYGDAVEGRNYPQTPMNVRLGIWAGGDKDNNNYTIEWAGGLTDFSKGPYSMIVQNVQVADFTTAAEYQWTDKSGSWESIKPVGVTSKAAQRILEPKGAINKFHALSPTTKVIIAAVAGGVFIVLLLLIGCCCFKQRRVGRHEREVADAEFEKNASELQVYRSRMQNGGFAVESGNQPANYGANPGANYGNYNPNYNPNYHR